MIYISGGPSSHYSQDIEGNEWRFSTSFSIAWKYKNEYKKNRRYEADGISRCYSRLLSWLEAYGVNGYEEILMSLNQ